MPRAGSTPSSTLHWQAWGLGLLALLLFCANAGQVAVIGFDSRFVLFAKEMLRHGPGFFPPPMANPMLTTPAPRPC